MRLQFTWIEANFLDFFLADVRNSRGKFDEIEEFAIKPTLIASQLSLNAGGSRRTQDFAPYLLNFFTNKSNVEIKTREEDRFKGNFRPKIMAV